MRSILFSFPYLPNHTALCFFPNSIIVIAADTTYSTISCAHSFMGSSINSGVVPFISFISGAWLLSPVADTVQILQPVHLNRLSRLYFVAKRLAQPYKTARYDTERHLQLRSSRIALRHSWIPKSRWKTYDNGRVARPWCLVRGYPSVWLDLPSYF